MSLIAGAFYLYFLKWLHLPLQNKCPVHTKRRYKQGDAFSLKKRRLPVSDILLLLPEIQNSKN